ncbi:hypothetical protein pb186bvf_015633 [Paramecium bursaria]
MFHDSSKSLLNKQESSYSFHIPTVSVETSPLKNPKLLAAIFLISQLLYLILGFELLQNNSVVVLGAKKCLCLVLISLGYIHFGNKQLYQLNQDCTRIMLAITGLQFILTLSGFYALANFPFSEACSFNQITPAYILVQAHILIQPEPQIVHITAGLQTLATFLYSNDFLDIVLSLLWPASQAGMSIIKLVRAREIPQFTLILYTNLLTFPLYLILIILNGQLGQLLSIHSFLFIILMCFFQILAIISMNELVQEQISQMQIWSLQGIVTILAIVFQIVFQGSTHPLGFGTIAVIFIVFSSIAIHSK